MKSNFKVNGKSGSTKSSIAHIERTHSLKKNVKKNSEIKDINSEPHIIIFQKNVTPKKINEVDPKTKTQISKQIQTYKTRLKKYLSELTKLTDPKKIELKEKTILRTETKIAELQKVSETILKKRPKYAFDFVDIPFSITKCSPDKLSVKDYEKLNQIALKIVTTLFDIDTKEVGQVAHLDQFSAHVHLSFHVPPGKTLTEITKSKINENGDEVKLTYGEMQQEFNRLVIEAFPHLPIEKISPNSEKTYLPLNQYKLESGKEKAVTEEIAKLKTQNKSLQEQNRLLSDTNITLQEKVNSSYSKEQYDNMVTKAKEIMTRQKNQILVLQEKINNLEKTSETFYEVLETNELERKELQRQIDHLTLINDEYQKLSWDKMQETVTTNTTSTTYKKLQ